MKHISMVKSMVSGSLMLVLSSQVASSIPIAALVYGAQLSFASPVFAASETKRNAQGLLADMRMSFGLIASSYREKSAPRHRSAASVLEAVTRAARATQRLEEALATHRSKAIAEATGDLSKAIGELQTRYALTVARNEQATQGMRYLNAAWKSYSSRYILSRSMKETKAASKGEIRALRKKIVALEERVASLEDQVATNAALRREVARLRQDLAYYDGRPDDYRTYQSMLLTLTVVSGSFDALTYTTRTYYPTYYAYFEPVNPDFDVWRSYWAGYYDGYYEGRESVWYDEPKVVEGPLVEINQIEINQEITYQTIYTTVNDTRVEYEALPNETLSEVDVPPPPEDMVFTANALTQSDNAEVPPQLIETVPAEAETGSDILQPNGESVPQNAMDQDAAKPYASREGARAEDASDTDTVPRVPEVAPAETMTEDVSSRQKEESSPQNDLDLDVAKSQERGNLEDDAQARHDSDAKEPIVNLDRDNSQEQPEELEELR